jgi:hypothetical protein
MAKTPCATGGIRSVKIDGAVAELNVTLHNEQ